MQQNSNNNNNNNNEENRHKTSNDILPFDGGLVAVAFPMKIKVNKKIMHILTKCFCCPYLVLSLRLVRQTNEEIFFLFVVSGPIYYICK